MKNKREKMNINFAALKLATNFYPKNIDQPVPEP